MDVYRLVRYRFSSLIRYVLISCVFMMALDQIGNFDAPWFITLLFAAIIGLLLGLYRMFIGFEFLRSWPLLLRIVFQIVIIQILIVVSANLIQLALGFLDLRDPTTPVRELLVSRDYVALYYKAQLFSFMLYFFISLENILGPSFLIDYVLGRYQRPTTESRILLFMDLKSSTQLAERMGDQKFYHFLNDTYGLLNKPLIFSKGEILKYVGDEVIITWKHEEGVALNNCLNFFTEYLKVLDQHKASFMKKYGTAPEFRAGMHSGKVVTAYLGQIKKQLDFSGDLMNTTSRIMDLAKSKGYELIVSEALFYQLHYDKIVFDRLPEAQLKGKEGMINLVGVNMKAHLKEMESKLSNQPAISQE